MARSEQADGAADPFDPFGHWKALRDSSMETWSQLMLDFVHSDAYAHASAQWLDAYLTMSQTFQGVIDQAMSQALSQYKIPTSDDIMRLAERILNIELRLDDLDARFDEIARLLKSQDDARIEEIAQMLKSQDESRSEEIRHLLKTRDDAHLDKIRRLQDREDARLDDIAQMLKGLREEVETTHRSAERAVTEARTAAKTVEHAFAQGAPAAGEAGQAAPPAGETHRKASTPASGEKVAHSKRRKRE